MAANDFLTKRIHFIRHGESLSNRLRRKINAHLLPQQEQPVTIDPALTREGEEQARRLTEYIENLQPNIAVSSPYTRALQTCLFSYGSKKVMVTHLCGEVMSAKYSVIGTPASCLKAIFPVFDFSALEEIWWYVQDGIKSQAEAVNLLTQGKLSEEPEEYVAARVEKFFEFLCKIPEQTILVYAHSDFLVAFLSKYYGVTRIGLENCEVYSINFTPVPAVTQ